MNPQRGVSQLWTATGPNNQRLYLNGARCSEERYGSDLDSIPLSLASDGT